MASDRLKGSGVRQMLPAVYITCGIITLALSPNIYGTLSGLLFIGAGILAIIRPGRQANPPDRRRRRQPRNTPEPRELSWEEHLSTGRAPSSRHAPAESPALDKENSGELRPPVDDRLSAVDGNIADGDSIPSSMLSFFSPFDELPESLRSTLADRLVISRKPAGTSLIKRGSRDDLCLYLVQGSLLLEAADGKRITVNGGTSRARKPLCQLRPHCYSVTALTDIVVLMMSQTLVGHIMRSIARHKQGNGIQVSEVAEDMHTGQLGEGMPR